jgi:hypothetical protein
VATGNTKPAIASSGSSRATNVLSVIVTCSTIKVGERIVDVATGTTRPAIEGSGSSKAANAVEVAITTVVCASGKAGSHAVVSLSLLSVSRK